MAEAAQMKELPRNPPTNPAADREPERPHKEPTLEDAIDDETGGYLRPSRDEVRSDKTTDDKTKH